MGTCEGYFPTANDLYLRGKNNAGFIHSAFGDSSFPGNGGMEGAVVFESNSLSITIDVPYGKATSYCKWLMTGKAYNLTGFSQINIELQKSYQALRKIHVGSLTNGTTQADYIGSIAANTGGTVFSVSLSLSATRYLVFSFHGQDVTAYINRIWLS